MTTDFRIHLVTWNVGETDPIPIQDFTELLNLDSPNSPNLYGIGLQELKSTTTQMVSNAVFDDPWTIALTDCLSAHNYVRIRSLRLVGMLLAVFIRREDLPYVSNVDAVFTRTGFGGYWGNKGTVTVRLDVRGVNLCIINSHFQAHPENFAARIEDYNMSVQGQRFKDKDSPTILDHDYVFWIGDLNFRIQELPNAEVRRKIQIRDFESLKKHDQLLIAREKQLIFVDFEEEPITFAPTFKFDTGTDDYDSSSKNRVPSWCDRILYLVHEDAYEGTDMSVRPLRYDSLVSYRTSDHKPVVGEFIIQVLKNAPEPPIMFEPLGSWCQSSDGKVSYVVNSSFLVQSRDWIGLYREGYKHTMDYVAYVWAGGKSEDMQDGTVMYSVVFDSSSLQKLPSDTYYLCYYSAHCDCIMGYSDKLRLLCTEESSESSSDEDECDGVTRQVAADNLCDNKVTYKISPPNDINTCTNSMLNNGFESKRQQLKEEEQLDQLQYDMQQFLLRESEFQQKEPELQNNEPELQQNEPEMWQQVPELQRKLQQPTELIQEQAQAEK